jgi:Di-haem oxidoreductase, putative peroxidase
MGRFGVFASLIAFPLLFATAVATNQKQAPTPPDESVLPVVVEAEIVATGIPGAGAIAQVGTFHKGGPFHDNATFAAFTQPGRVLDRTRLFVASTSNFGAPLARPAEAPGSILSIDPSGGAVAVPPTFAIGGGQAIGAGGRVILYTAQSPAFLNGNNNPSAATSDRPAVSLPLGISFNNGFGRPWFASAPTGSSGDGTISVTDPSGVPLANAPDATAGGVFTGTVTNRDGASIGGLTSAAVATALATKSPDLSIRAVFFAALADGSVAQVHVQKGVDALMPAGSFTPLAGISQEAAESADPNVVTRVGMVFNWLPTRIVYVTDPLADRLLAFDVTNEDADAHTLFEAKNARYLSSPHLDKPIDIAPAVPEVGARNFASNTTLGGGSDFYILNRGNNTIVRMTQEGRVLAVRRLEAPVADFRVNGLAVSEDARTIWVTATAPGRQGVVLQIATFGAAPVTTTLIDHATSVGANGAAAQGADIFENELGPEQSLGPLFNGQACDSCHNTVAGAVSPVAGGMGTSNDSFVTRVARIEHGRFDPLAAHGGPIARQRSIAEFGFPCGLPVGIPPEANATSIRSAMTLRGTSLLDNIRVTDLENVRSSQPDDVRGRLNVLPDGRVGRFGWKAQTATLVEFMAEAFRDEIGVTNPLAPRDLVRGCGASILKPEADAAPLTSLVAFLDTIDPPVPGPACLGTPASPSAGAAVFAAIGCATCHRPTMPGPGSAGPVPTTIRPYTDLLLHDMGPELADGFEQGSAGGREFRTMPLWRVADRQQFLHDGRVRFDPSHPKTINDLIGEAIEAHGGQAAASVAAFKVLSAADLQALLDYLNCI